MTNRKFEVRGIDDLEDVHAFRTDDRDAQRRCLSLCART